MPVRVVRCAGGATIGRADLLARVENIPFLETRLYVKAVLAARAHYARRMGESELSMQEFVRRKMRNPT